MAKNNDFQGNMFSCTYQGIVSDMITDWSEPEAQWAWSSVSLKLTNSGAFTGKLGLILTSQLDKRCDRISSPVGSVFGGRSIQPQPGHIIFIEVDHEIIVMAILPLPLFQEGQLSVAGESMCTMCTKYDERSSNYEGSVFRGQFLQMKYLRHSLVKLCCGMHNKHKIIVAEWVGQLTESTWP